MWGGKQQHNFQHFVLVQDPKATEWAGGEVSFHVDMFPHTHG